MFFGKETFTDANENMFYNLLSVFPLSFNLYRPKIHFTYNYDNQNYFGLNAMGDLPDT